LSFDGGNDYISADNSALNTIADGDFTFEAWINADLIGQNAHPTIFSNRPVPGTGSMFFFHNIWGGSAYKMLCVQLGGLNYFVFDNGTYDATFFDGVCHHVAITREGSLLSFYADGVFFGTRTIATDPSAGSTVDLWIGQDDPTINTFNGNISQLRIWNVARTEAEISDNKDVCISGDTPNLLAYWELNDGSGQVVADKTGSTNGELGSIEAVDTSDPIWGVDCCISCCVPENPCWETLTICESSGMIDLDTLLCPESSTIGTWSGDGVVGSIFDPSGLSGDVAITYNIGVAPCDTFLTQTISVLEMGPIVNAGMDQTICEGTVVTLEAFNPGEAEINWDNGVVDGVPFTPEIGSTTYSVEASFSEGDCSVSSDEITITVSPLPNVSFIADSLIGCAPFDVTFTNLSTSPSSACTWDFGDGNISTDCESTVHNYTSAGDFDVTLTVNFTNGCVNSTTYSSYVSVVNTPIAAFIPSSNFINTLNNEINLTNTSLYADSYIWDFGDDSPFSNETNPNHNYDNEESESYTVTLIASRMNPVCSDTVKKNIQTEDLTLIYVPNAITVDNDEFNQTFKPIISEGVDYYDYHLTIFNRWGEKIFESYNYDFGWNGEYGDRGIVPGGVYIWVIEFGETNTDRRRSKTGHISVLK